MERRSLAARAVVACASLCLLAAVTGCSAMASVNLDDSTQVMVNDALEEANLEVSDVAAVVEGTVVTQDTLAEAVTAERVRLGISSDTSYRAYLADRGMSNWDFKSMVLKGLIDDILVEHAAQRLDISVEDQEVTEYIAAVEALYPNHESFVSIIKSCGFTERSYARAVRLQLLRQYLAEEVIPVPEPTPEQIEAHAREVMAGITMKRSSFILIPRDKYDVALEVQQRLMEGEDFMDLARQYTIDLGSEHGVDAGWDFLSMFPEEYVDALTCLEVGEVSPIVATRFGFYIIKCTDIYEAQFDEDGAIDFDAIPVDIMDSIKNTLRENLESELYGLYLNNLEASATIAVFDGFGNQVTLEEAGISTSLDYNPTLGVTAE